MTNKRRATRTYKEYKQHKCIHKCNGKFKMNATMLLASIVGLFLIAACSEAKPDYSVAKTPRKTQCSSNEEWVTCGTACPRSCENPNPQICTLQCIIGCQCVEGFLLNEAGKCVRPSECAGCHTTPVA